MKVYNDRPGHLQLFSPWFPAFAATLFSLLASLVVSRLCFPSCLPPAFLLRLLLPALPPLLSILLPPFLSSSWTSAAPLQALRLPWYFPFCRPPLYCYCGCCGLPPACLLRLSLSTCVLCSPPPGFLLRLPLSVSCLSCLALSRHPLSPSFASPFLSPVLSPHSDFHTFYIWAPCRSDSCLWKILWPEYATTTLNYGFFKRSFLLQSCRWHWGPRGGNVARWYLLDLGPMSSSLCFAMLSLAKKDCCVLHSSQGHYNALYFGDKNLWHAGRSKTIHCNPFFATPDGSKPHPV